ncbi:hypothetical protein D1872_35860 [compost metagenome]
MLDLVKYGCRSGNAFDNTDIIQRAIGTSGETVFSLPAGNFRVNGTIKINKPGIRFCGNNYGREIDNATIIEHYGNGSLFQIGDENAPYYGGPQGFKLENISLVNKSPLSKSLQNPYSRSIKRDRYGDNSIAIQDWRGGGMILTNVQIEHFYQAIWGCQSDINRLNNVNLFYNYMGLCFEPGSDQLSVTCLYTIGNDNVVNLNGCNGARFNDCQFVKEGEPSKSPIQLDYCNSVRFDGCWFESLNSGMESISSYVKLGENVECRGIVFRDSTLAILDKTESGIPACNYFIEVIRAKSVRIDEINGHPKNLKKLILFNGNHIIQQITVSAHLDYTYPDGTYYDKTADCDASINIIDYLKMDTR